MHIKPQHKAQVKTGQYYGNLARVAIGFYLVTGNPAEQHAAIVYARKAAHAVR